MEILEVINVFEGSYFFLFVWDLNRVFLSQTKWGMKLLYLDQKQIEKRNSPPKIIIERKRPKTIIYLVLFNFLLRVKCNTQKSRETKCES